MQPPPGADDASRRSRPRDRRERILAVAANRFWALGYHRTSIAGIASAVGVGPSALYHHFRSKQGLLLAVMQEAVGRLDKVVADAGRPQELFDELVRLGLDRRELGALWEREARHLPRPERHELAGRLRAVIEGTVQAVASQLPGEPAERVELRARAVLAVVESPSFHRVEVGRAGFADVLTRAVRAVVQTALPSCGEPASTGTAAGRDPQRPTTRREALLRESIPLFARRGFPAVSLADIGAAAGISGPSVYNYFSSKHDLLTGNLNRGNESLWLDLHVALSRAAGPADALHRALDSYVDFVVNHPDLVSVMLTEQVHLPEAVRETYRQIQADYLAEWVALLCRSRPELGEHAARAVVHATLTVSNQLVRIPRLHRRRALTADLTALGRAILDSASEAPSDDVAEVSPVA